MATIINGNSYRFKAWNDNLYLNIYTRGSLANGQNVCTYALMGTDMAQVWDVRSYSGYGVSGQLMKSKKNNSYALDHWRGNTNTHNADIYTVGTSAGDLKDQLVEFAEISNGCYRIKLKYPTSTGSYLYLTVNSSTTPHNVYWTTMTGNTDQLWYRELYTDSSYVPPTIPSRIGTGTHFIKDSSSGLYLNVYGSDTVSNGRNVNVYSLEDCLAQRWQRVRTTDGPKLFTRIDNTHVLNVYDVNSNLNCVMYTASSTYDSDQTVEFVASTLGRYWIKLAHHGLYLRAEGSTSGSNVSWTGSQSSATEWLFESSGDGGSGTNPDYTGVLARNLVLPNETGNSPYIVSNIPDKQVPVTQIENNVQFHPACGLANGCDFLNSSEGTAIRNQLQKYVKKVFDPNAVLSDAQTCYYLWGERIANVQGADFHSGVDVSYYDGAPIHALYGGTVKYSGGNYGTVSIESPEIGVVCNYVHMNDIQVSLNTNVSAGQVIGKQSNVSPRSIGSHLHFEVRPLGKYGPASLPTQPSSQMTTIMPYGYMDGVV